MPIVFSAFVPHPPILIPNIGKENLSRLAETEKAYQKLAGHLYAQSPEVIIVFSPHGIIQENVFTINLAPRLLADFIDFGEAATKLEFKGSIGLAHHIRETLETAQPLQMATENRLDHGASIALFMLAQNLKNFSVLPIYPAANLSFQDHFAFGQSLKPILLKDRRRIAIIASGDLSHRLSPDSPAGYWPRAKKFDQKIIEYLQNKKTDSILRLDPQKAAAASECGLRPLVMLLGILDKINYTPRFLSYQAPFGVGYLVMEFKI